jgi:hypothetical protein
MSNYKSFHVGLDLARESDYSAASVIEKQTFLDRHNRTIGVDFSVIMLKRWQRKTPYPEIVSDIAGRLKFEPFTHSYGDTWKPILLPCFLAVDRTGIGTAVMDIIKGDSFISRRCEIRPIHISGGFRQHEHRDFDSIPKSDLVQNLVVAFQQKILKISRALPEAINLVGELENFEMKATNLGNDIFGAKSGQHDDLVMSLSLSFWSARNFDDEYDDGRDLARALNYRGKPMRSKFSW